jgi:predicted RecA/RadA family phage recombinase
VKVSPADLFFQTRIHFFGVLTMAQSAASHKQNPGAVDYTPGSAVTGGDVVIVGGKVMVALADIAANNPGSLCDEGVFEFPKETGAIAYGSRVFWKPSGSPVSGDASSGAASDVSGDYVAGLCVKAAGSDDKTVQVLLLPAVNRPAVKPVAATGSAQGDATALIEGFNLVSAADGTKGVVLPAAAPGVQTLVKNNANAVLKVYPATGDAINALSANAAISLAAFTSALFTAYDETTHYTLPLLPS